VLRDFTCPNHELQIARFRELDSRHTAVTQALLAARLAARVPRLNGSANPTSELGILQRELQKRRAHLPIRQLLQRCRTLLPALKPCLLMSPISVSQYLDAAHPPFDLVVFDEASQIPVWDAIGAVARGRAAVIVGDPRQLPPTRFFQRQQDDEADPAAEELIVEDLESVLDECLASHLPTLTLDWHYRSRHESLIAFSNLRYYHHRLHTFPAAARAGLGVHYHHVPSVYDKGTTRTNRAEAAAVVAEVLRRLRDPQLARHSLGVVTFNLPQQSLIEDLLDDARRTDPALEAAFGDDVDEPPFVKNLENVQGDERDVIIFSLTYGPDANGQVSHNFGPLNQDGGERRLNVAITRARREVHVFTALRPEQIDLARTQARGVADLRAFLDYAQRDATALVPPPSGAPPHAALLDELAACLTAAGHQVHRQIGCSAYRLDLAVVDPTHPERYLLGVETDGPAYALAHTARDRDKLRAAVLGQLGWHLHRVWALEYWLSPERERQRLLAAVEQARQAPPPAPPPPPPPPAPVVTAPVEPVPLVPYRVYVPPEQWPAEALYQPQAEAPLLATADAVIACEGPIGAELLLRRVADAWGIARLTERVRTRLALVLSRGPWRHTTSGGLEFWWPPELEPTTWRGFRVPDADDPATARSLDELPLEEFANAARHILATQYAMPRAELARETAKLFGLKRLNPAAQSRAQAALALLDQP
jgi:very-short-patch-repair endonuclease